MNTVRLVAIFAENRPGQTALVTKVLSEARLNIRWATITSLGASGVMKFLVSDPDAARQALRQAGFAVTFLEVLAVEVPDRPGALHAVADCLARHGINLDNTSGFVTDGRAILILEVQEVVRACAVLQQAGLRLLSQREMLETGPK